MASKFVILLCAAFVLPAAGSAYGAVTDPAAIQVQILTTALIKSMRTSPTASMTERYRDLEPVIEQVFALPFMTRVSVGPDWANFLPEQQKATLVAFSRFTIANYLHHFRDFEGQKFEIDDNVQSRGEYKLVQTKLIPAHGEPVNLLYRMREVDGTWKIVDVFYNGISELILHRTDFTAAIAAGGAPELITHLNKVSDDLMK